VTESSSERAAGVRTGECPGLMNQGQPLAEPTSGLVGVFARCRRGTAAARPQLDLASLCAGRGRGCDGALVLAGVGLGLYSEGSVGVDWGTRPSPSRISSRLRRCWPATPSTKPCTQASSLCSPRLSWSCPRPRTHRMRTTRHCEWPQGMTIAREPEGLCHPNRRRGASQHNADGQRR